MKARVLAGLLVLLAIVLGAILEVAWGQTPQIEGLDRLTPEERAIAERNLERWQRTTPEQRARGRGRWRKIPHGERERRREQGKSATPEERGRLRQQYGGQRPPRGQERSR